MALSSGICYFSQRCQGGPIIVNCDYKVICYYYLFNKSFHLYAMYLYNQN